MHYQPEVKAADLSLMSICDLAAKATTSRLYATIESWIEWEMNKGAEKSKEVKAMWPEGEGFWAFENEQNAVVCAVSETPEGAIRYELDCQNASEAEVIDALHEFKSVLTQTKKRKMAH
jgi:hypothetical protein